MLASSVSKFKVFICHSQQSDRAVANNLKLGLERFARPRGERRSMRVFLDTAVLTPNQPLWPEIQNALNSSEYLLLVATPDSANSKWVKREISHWLAHRDEKSIIVALAGGTLVWNDQIGDYDENLTTSLPKSLFGIFHDEPLYVDIRVNRLKDEATYWDTIATISSTLHGRPKDDLIAADLTSHRLEQAESCGLRAELAQVSGQNSRAIHLLIDSYKHNPSFAVLEKILSLHNKYNGDVVWRCTLSGEGLAATETTAYVIVGRYRHGPEYDPQWTSRSIKPDGSEEILFSPPTLARASVLDVISKSSGAIEFTIDDIGSDPFQYGLASAGDEIFFMKRGEPIPNAPILYPEGNLYDKPTGHLCRLKAASEQKPKVVGQTRYVGAFAVSHDGGKIAVNWLFGACVYKFDHQSGFADRPFFSNSSFGYHAILNEMRLSKSGHVLAFAAGADSHLDNWNDDVGAYDLAKSQPCFEWSGANRHHSKQVNSVDVSPDDKLLVSASNDGTIAVIDIEDGSVKHQWNTGGKTLRVRFMDNGHKIVSTMKSETIVWETSSGKRLKSYQIGGANIVSDPKSCVFYTIGSEAYCFDLNRSEKILDLSELKQTGKPAFDRAGQISAIPCRTQGWANSIVIRFFDTDDGTDLGHFAPGPNDTALYLGEISESGTHVALLTGISTPKDDSPNTWRITKSAFSLFDVKRLKEVIRIESGAEDYIRPTAFSFHPASELLAITGASGIDIFQIHPFRSICSHNGSQSLAKVAWHGQGKLLACHSHQGEILLFDFDASKQVLTLQRSISIKEKEIIGLAFDDAFDALHVFLKGNGTIQISLFSENVRTLATADTRQANIQTYVCKRKLSELPRDELPIASPYLHKMDGWAVRAMRSELLEPSPGIGVVAEELLETIRAASL